MKLNLPENLKKLREKYTINKEELGKVMIVASLTLSVVSIQATIGLQNASNQASTLYENLKETDAMVNSQDFNESIDALEDTEGTRLASRFLRAAETFRSVQNTTQTAESLDDRLKSEAELYQWTTLISLLGVVTGILLYKM